MTQPEVCPNLPRNLAVIMDGNGRWAKTRGLSRMEGHRHGVEATRRLVETVAQKGIGWLTLFCFSSENWTRPSDEVSGLFELMRRGLHGEVPELLRNRVRVRVIGSRTGIPADLVAMLASVEKRSVQNEGLSLVLALNYGGRAEIVQAAKKWQEAVVRGDEVPEDLDEERFRQFLLSPDIPYPDLLIRTGGEHRLSNFMLWQLAYTEMVFTDCLWPDFRETHLQAALDAYAARERRFGGLGAYNTTQAKEG